jgi:hypothetical protein
MYLAATAVAIKQAHQPTAGGKGRGLRFSLIRIHF